MPPIPIDEVHLNYCANLENVVLIKVILGFVMFGVALELTVDDFKNIARNPKGTLVGLASQVFVLPILTILLIFLLKPSASIALGMILVAACPGGSVSNFLGVVAKANAALQVTLSALTTVVGLFFTPFNFWLYGSMYPPSAAMLKEISVSPFEVGIEIFIVLGTPLALGMLMRHYAEPLALKLNKPMKNLSLGIFALIVIGAVIKELDNIVLYGTTILSIVVVHNASGFIGGYWFGRMFGLPERDCRSVCIETGLQNSGLGLGLVCGYFGGLGGMAMVAAAWGVWHLIAGGTVALYWSRRPVS